MKWMIASDIHGSEKYCRMMLSRFEQEKADRLLLLGDLLYHGPRNELPEAYSPKEVMAMLNSMKDILLCVRGNCDAEVDQMVLSFPIMAEYAVIADGERLIYATHGHHAGEEHPLPMRSTDILLCGHTHIPKCVRHETFTYMNPGSVSLPKEGSPHSYMTMENGVYLWKDILTGESYRPADC